LILNIDSTFLNIFYSRSIEIANFPIESVAFHLLYSRRVRLRFSREGLKCEGYAFLTRVAKQLLPDATQRNAWKRVPNLILGTQYWVPPERWGTRRERC